MRRYDLVAAIIFGALAAAGAVVMALETAWPLDEVVGMAAATLLAVGHARQHLRGPAAMLLAAGWGVSAVACALTFALDAHGQFTAFALGGSLLCALLYCIEANRQGGR